MLDKNNTVEGLTSGQPDEVQGKCCEHDGVLILLGVACFQHRDWPTQGRSFSRRSAAGEVTSQNRIGISRDKDNDEY